MHNRYSRSAALSALLLVSAQAQAVEYKLTTGLTSERTDNVGRASEESGLVQKDWIHKPTLRGLLDHESNTLQLSADYLLEYRIYTEDVFEDRPRWTGRADLRWDAIPEYLQLNVTNSRTETTEDSLFQDVETNRQVTAVTSAGPKLYFRPRTNDELSLAYQYSDISQGQTNSDATLGLNQTQARADSTRHLTSLAYEVGFTENRSLTAQLSRDKVDFERNAPDLEIYTAALLYSSKGDVLDIQARAGYTSIDRTLNRSKVDGVIGNLDFTWQVSGSGEFKFGASRSINDQSSDVLRGTANFGQGAVFENTDVNEVFDEHVLRASYTHRWGRNTATLGYRLQIQDFEDSAFAPGQSRDEEDHNFTAYYARRLRPTVDVRLGAGVSRRKFDGRGVDEDYLTADFRLNWQASRSLALFVGANYEDRDATGPSPLVNQLTYNEFVYLFGFNFDLVNRYKLQQKR